MEDKRKRSGQLRTDPSWDSALKYQKQIDQTTPTIKSLPPKSPLVNVVILHLSADIRLVLTTVPSPAPFQIIGPAIILR